MATDRPNLTPEQEFAARVSATANKQLATLLGTDAGKKAAHAITMAMLSAMRTSRSPRAFLEVTEASVADCVATSHETGLHPGGPNPVVYLVPQAPRKGAQPELQWRITHRGLAILAARAGYGVLAVPVSVDDMLRVEFGEAVVHEADPYAWPESLDDIQGMIVVVRRISDGVTISRAWMPRQAVLRRRDVSRDGAVWESWPVEMAQKTALKWAFARGYVPLDSPEMRAAMGADERSGTIDIVATAAEPARPAGRAALGLDRPPAPETRALPDHGDQPVPDYREEADRLAERETVEAGAAPVEQPEVMPRASEQPRPQSRGGRPGGFGGGR